MQSTLPPTNGPAGNRGWDDWYRIFRTLIAGAIVAVIVWLVVQRLLSIIIVLVVSFLVAFLVVPGVDRLERGGVPRVIGALLLYLVILGAISFGGVFLFGPLTNELTQLIHQLPAVLDTNSGSHSRLAQFLQQHGLDYNSIRTQVTGYIANAGTTVLGGTLQIVTGVVDTITNILLVLVIAFYLILDGRNFRNRAVRLLPVSVRDRWFFIEATLNMVLGGYLRGQLIVAATVGIAAGVGCQLIGVHDALVIGLLAFLCELIPMIGPVLGAAPAVLISLFQSPSPWLLVIVYFTVLQQVESNLIVPRVSGHAVGLHPLAALLALIAGLNLGGVGGAVLAVPLAGMIYVLLMALYSDATGQSHLLVNRPRSRTYDFLARRIDPLRGRIGEARPGKFDAINSTAPVTVTNERLSSIQHGKEQLAEQFEADVADKRADKKTAADDSHHTAASPAHAASTQGTGFADTAHDHTAAPPPVRSA